MDEADIGDVTVRVFEVGRGETIMPVLELKEGGKPVVFDEGQKLTLLRGVPLYLKEPTRRVVINDELTRLRGEVTSAQTMMRALAQDKEQLKTVLRRQDGIIARKDAALRALIGAGRAVLSQIDQGDSPEGAGKVFGRDDCIARLRKAVKEGSDV